jgi:large conductance mechanosensitive channel
VKELLEDFRKFLFRGNVVDLAVAVVIGTAFTAVVKALVADMLTPLIAMIFGEPNFSTLSFTINSSHFLYGDVLNAILTFASIAAVVFFVVVKPMAVLASLRNHEDPSVKECPECCSEIPVAAKRCPMCTTRLAANEHRPRIDTGAGPAPAL